MLTLIGSVRTVNADGLPLPKPRLTPLDIAKAKKHTALYGVLKPVINNPVPDTVLRSLQTKLHQHICKVMGWPNKGKIRLPELEVLKEGNGVGYFPLRPGVNDEVCVPISCAIFRLGNVNFLMLQNG
jgi:hypothetical protein